MPTSIPYVLLNKRKVTQLAALVFGLNIIVLSGTWLAHLPGLQNRSFLFHILNLFDLSSENNLAAWYSSCLLFVCSATCIACFYRDQYYLSKYPKRYVTYWWLVNAVCFAILSFDELGSFHETIGDSLLFKQLGSTITNSADSGWTIFTGMVVTVGSFMLAFTLFILRRVPSSAIFFTLGIICYLSNPIQENFEIQSLHMAADSALWKRPVSLLLLEEGSEVFGSFFFFISLLTYLLKATQEQIKPHAGTKQVFLPVPLQSTSKVVYICILLLLVTMVLVQLMVGSVTGNAQTGVPQNWFLAVLPFQITAYTFYRYSDRTLQKPVRLNLLSISLLGMVMSAFFGSNMYAESSIITGSGQARKLVLTGAIFLFAVIVTIKQTTYLKAKAKLLATSWLVLLCFPLFVHHELSPLMGTAGLCIFLGLLVKENNFVPDPFVESRGEYNI